MIGGKERGKEEKGEKENNQNTIKMCGDYYEVHYNGV